MADLEHPPPPLAGRYKLEERLGAGGMGVVWRARDQLLMREVAVKEVRPAPYLPEAQRADLSERTMREARAAAMLSHPSIVAVHDVILHDGRPWIVMDLVKGRSLEQVVKRDGPLPPERTAMIGLAVLDALAHAHRGGLMHRDVKPGNIMIADDGRVLLTDFGIATLENDTGPTRPGSLVGSPGYIAPERLRGVAEAPPADLWSLGATLFAAVEGHSPFHRATPVATLGAVLTQPTPEPAHAGHLAPVLIAVLEKDPRVRPGAAELRTALRHVAEGRPAPALRRRSPTRRRRIVAAAVAGVAALAVLGTALWTMSRDGSGGTVAATATPSADPRAGRFTELPDPCGLLTLEQGKLVVPTPSPQVDAARQRYCDWGGSSDERWLRVKLTLYKPAKKLTAPEVAHAFLVHLRQNIAADAGTGLVGSVFPLRSVTGVGQDGFAYEGTSLDRTSSTVVFQSSNLLVEADLSMKGKKPTEDLKERALKSARSIAEELNSRG
ncbi:serine/threonine-protein kinase [Spongiactinospora sp. 9N601]|uniref:serine/threonine-protein kinase n=1 Tax=Spongiactinospora sp. 9N601 TaxID=3375149 RepID=UPI0037B57564